MVDPIIDLRGQFIESIAKLQKNGIGLNCLARSAQRNRRDDRS
jgi:hypothetical protein